MSQIDDNPVDSEVLSLPCSTTFEFAGWRVERQIGLCWGLIVRSIGLVWNGLSSAPRDFALNDL